MSIAGVSVVRNNLREKLTGEVEGYLQGRAVSTVDAAFAAGLTLPSAKPMAGNAYKITLARNLIKRATEQLLKSA